MMEESNIIEKVIEIQNALVKGNGKITIADEFQQYEIDNLVFKSWSAVDDKDHHCQWVVYLDDYGYMVNVHYVEQLNVTWQIIS